MEGFCENGNESLVSEGGHREDCLVFRLANFFLLCTISLFIVQLQTWVSALYGWLIIFIDSSLHKT
jgi:hypothetical protein